MFKSFNARKEAAEGSGRVDTAGGAPEGTGATEPVAGERVLWSQVLKVSAMMNTKREEHLLPDPSPSLDVLGGGGGTVAKTSPSYHRCRLIVRAESRDGSFVETWLTDADDDGRAMITVTVPAFQWWRAVITATEAPD